MVLLLVVLSLVLSACGGSADDDAAPSDGGGNGNEGSTAVGGAPRPTGAQPAPATELDRSGDNGSQTGRDGEDREGRQDGEDAEALSPLGAYLGYAIPGIDGMSPQERRRRYMDAVATCMQAEGFPYVSWVPEPGSIVAPVEEGLDHESREFAAKYGFGVSTQYFSQDDVGPGLLGYTGAYNELNLDSDPNHVIRESLTPEERDAYDRAYVGADSPFWDRQNYDDEAEGVPLGWAMSNYGCIGEGERAVSADAWDLMGLFAAEIVAMPAEARADDRFLRYVDSVERCVHEAGYDFYAAEPQWAVLAHFDDLVAEVDEMVGQHPLAGLTEKELGMMTEEEIQARYDAPRFLTPSAKARLAEVQDLETAVAVTAWDCGANPVEQRRVLDEVMAGIHTDFIDEHRETLEELRRTS